MLLKITDKIIRRYVYEQKKQKPGLSANQAFEQLRPVEYLLHVLYTRPTHSGQCLLKLQALETNHTISQAFKTFS